MPGSQISPDAGVLARRADRAETPRLRTRACVLASLSYDDQCGVFIAGVQSSEEARRRTSEWLRKSVP
jgi:hypothetical protein